MNVAGDVVGNGGNLPEESILKQGLKISMLRVTMDGQYRLYQLENVGSACRRDPSSGTRAVYACRWY